MNNNTAKLIPYGITNFASLMTSNYYYVDKTSYIPTIERVSRYFFIVRPRRFGKSLFINMLSHYYDKARAVAFEDVFKGTYIGENPTPLHSSYVVLSLDFSGIMGRDLQEMEDSFNSYMCIMLDSLVSYNARIFTPEEKNEVKQTQKCIDKLTHICALLQEKGEKMYLMRSDLGIITTVLR